MMHGSFTLMMYLQNWKNELNEIRELESEFARLTEEETVSDRRLAASNGSNIGFRFFRKRSCRSCLFLLIISIRELKNQLNNLKKE